LRELTDRDGTLHRIWVPVLPAAWEKGGETPNYERKRRKHLWREKKIW
jgi:hypothetical protein